MTLEKSGAVTVEPLLDGIHDSDLKRQALRSIGESTDLNQQVAVFHRLYGLPILHPSKAHADFSHISRERLAMRFGLIVEEFMELCDAMDIRADINFHYLNEEGIYTQAKSGLEQAASDRGENIGEYCEYLFDEDKDTDTTVLNHDAIDDDFLQRIVRERLMEAIENTEERSMVEVADACCDLKYVVIGFEYENGIEPYAVAREVQASNLSKLGGNGKPIYRADGKVLKGPDYFKPRVELALRAYGMPLGKVFGG